MSFCTTWQGQEAAKMYCCTSKLLQSWLPMNPYFVYVCKVYADLLLQLLPRGEQCIKQYTDGTSGSSRPLLTAFNFHRYIVHRNNFCSYKKSSFHQVSRLTGARWSIVGMIIIHIMLKYYILSKSINVCAFSTGNLSWCFILDATIKSHLFVKAMDVVIFTPTNCLVLFVYFVKNKLIKITVVLIDINLFLFWQDKEKHRSSLDRKFTWTIEWKDTNELKMALRLMIFWLFVLNLVVTCVTLISVRVRPLTKYPLPECLLYRI